MTPAWKETYGNGRQANLPGHNVVQAIFCTLCPSQKAPPLSGAGLVQVLVRFWYPRPQRLLHTDHSVQVDQPPFTESRKAVTGGCHIDEDAQTTHSTSA